MNKKLLKECDRYIPSDRKKRSQQRPLDSQTFLSISPNSFIYPPKNRTSIKAQLNDFWSFFARAISSNNLNSDRLRKLVCRDFQHWNDVVDAGVFFEARFLAAQKGNTREPVLEDYQQALVKVKRKLCKHLNGNNSSGNLKNMLARLNGLSAEVYFFERQKALYNFFIARNREYPEPQNPNPILARMNPTNFFSPFMEASVSLAKRVDYTEDPKNRAYECLIKALSSSDNPIQVFNQAAKKSFLAKTPEEVRSWEEVADLLVFLTARRNAAVRIKKEKTEPSIGEPTIQDYETAKKDVLKNLAKLNNEKNIITQIQTRVREKSAGDFYDERSLALMNHIARATETEVSDFMQTQLISRRKKHLIKTTRKAQEEFFKALGENQTNQLSQLARQLGLSENESNIRTPEQIAKLGIFIIARSMAAEDKNPRKAQVLIIPQEQHYKRAVESFLTIVPSIAPNSQNLILILERYKKHYDRLYAKRKLAEVLGEPIKIGIRNLFTKKATIQQMRRFLRKQKFSKYMFHAAMAYVTLLQEEEEETKKKSQNPFKVFEKAVLAQAKIEKEHSFDLFDILQKGSVHDLGLYLERSLMSHAELQARIRKTRQSNAEEMERSVWAVKKRLLQIRHNQTKWDQLQEAGKVNWVHLYSVVCTPDELEDLCAGVVDNKEGKKLDFRDLHALRSNAIKPEPYEDLETDINVSSFTSISGSDALRLPYYLYELARSLRESFASSWYEEQNQNPLYANTLTAHLRRVGFVRSELNKPNSWLFTRKATGRIYSFAWSYDFTALPSEKQEPMLILPALQVLMTILPKEKNNKTSYLSTAGVLPGLTGRGYGRELINAYLTDTLEGATADEKRGTKHVLGVARTINPDVLGALYYHNVQAIKNVHLALLLGGYMDQTAFRLIFGWISAKHTNKVINRLQEEFKMLKDERKLGALLCARVLTKAYFCYLGKYGETTGQLAYAKLTEKASALKTWGLSEEENSYIDKIFEEIYAAATALGKEHGQNNKINPQEFITLMQQLFDEFPT